MSAHIDRRRFLAGMAGAAGGIGLAACGGSGDDDGPGLTGGSPGSVSPTASNPAGSGSASNSASPTQAATLPARVPFADVRPDIPAGDDGLPAGFFHYPPNPPSVVSGPVGSGETVTLMTPGSITVPRGDNQWWQSLEESLNIKWKFLTVPSADYNKKFQVSLAGEDIADLMYLVQVQNMPEVLDKYFLDLTPHLAGDKAADYPGLASLPTAAWAAASVNGKIWGIPQPRVVAGSIISMRGDLLDKLGVTPDVHSGADFVSLCKELTDVKRSKFAIGQQPDLWVLNAVLEMMEAPNGWQQDGGKFTSVFEAPQMQDALSQVKTMWDAGYIHPDSFANRGASMTWWSGGTSVIYFQNFAGWPVNAARYPDWDITVIPAPKWGGGGLAHKILGKPAPAHVGLKRTDDDARIASLLRVCDYLAAPFGSREYLEVTYGVAGHDYDLDGSDPVPNDTGKAELPPIGYVGSQQFVNLYSPTDKDVVTDQHDYLAAVLPGGVQDASLGLYSETNLSEGNAAAKVVSDAKADIIQGRMDISKWPDVVAAWRKRAGDKIRREYEEAYAQSH